MKINKTTNKIVGKSENILLSIFKNTFCCFCISFILFPFSTLDCINSTKASVLGTITLFSSSLFVSLTLTVVLPVVISIFSTFPASISFTSSV